MRQSSVLLLGIIITITSLGYKKDALTDDDLTIRVRTFKSYPTEQWSNIQTGMIWALSHLGATLRRNSIHAVLQNTKDSTVLELHLGKAGFNPKAQQALFVIVDSLKKTEEYNYFCAIDLGRFLVLTLHSPHHYYAITDIAPSLAAFKNRHDMDNANLQHFPVVRSSIAHGNRILHFKTGSPILEAAFIAEEGIGRLELGNFEATEFEVFDIMPNGQLRFAIYDKNGDLKTATPTSLGEAGKPGKCLWCHESTINTLFTPTYNVPGQLTKEAFLDTIKQLNAELFRYQNSLFSDIEFRNPSDHTQHELLYITFMEPSAMRIAQEWNVPVDLVKQRLKNVPTHQYNEYPWIGKDLYHRADIDRLSPFRPIPIPESVREPSNFEPDFFVKRGKSSTDDE